MKLSTRHLREKASIPEDYERTHGVYDETGGALLNAVTAAQLCEY